ncbi:hypothetical protein [Sulfurospirillum oryzae]|uniref:hypothetical protein n=1 Tax=Sulfurospirillum oryzae TaxID=2976535 RepID=UPI0021E89970|nr:hypothetical protein [Sulfurospirillum oryzae]
MRFISTLLIIVGLCFSPAFAKGSSGSHKSSSSKSHSSSKSSSSKSYSDVSVKGYTKKDGTHVSAYKRTSPNSSKSDNYSTKGNVNPYTGKKGTKNP